MTEEQLIQFAKNEIASGKGFAETQTELLINYGKTIGEANRIVSLAKEELGIPADADEEDIKDAKYELIGSKINLLSWVLFALALIILFFESSESQWGQRFFFLSISLSGLSIFLRERIRLSFFKFNGFIAKILGAIAFLGGLSGVLETF